MSWFCSSRQAKVAVRYPKRGGNAFVCIPTNKSGTKFPRFATLPRNGKDLIRGPIEYRHPEARQQAVATRAGHGLQTDRMTLHPTKAASDHAYSPLDEMNGFLRVSRSLSRSETEFNKYPNARTENAVATPRTSASADTMPAPGSAVASGSRRKCTHRRKRMRSSQGATASVAVIAPKPLRIGCARPSDRIMSTASDRDSPCAYETNTTPQYTSHT